MTSADAVLLIAAGLTAGTVNAVAGGGTFFTFSALVAAGVPPISANVSSAVALTPANVSSVVAYWPEVRRYARRYVPLAIASMAGGLAGAVLLLSTPGEAFRAVVPWLLGFATLLFAVAPLLLRAINRIARGPSSPFRRRIGALLQFLVSIYGGYFGAGMGIVMLSSMTLSEGDDYHFVNAAKNVCALLIQLVALGPLIAAGLVAWPEAVVGMAAAAAGGYWGVAIARRLPLPAIRWFVVVVGALLTIRFAIAA